MFSLHLIFLIHITSILFNTHMLYPCICQKEFYTCMSYNIRIFASILKIMPGNSSILGGILDFLIHLCVQAFSTLHKYFSIPTSLGSNHGSTLCITQLIVLDLLVYLLVLQALSFYDFFLGVNLYLELFDFFKEVLKKKKN